ncbi:MAG: guanylate kinase [Coriobacteriales bacterium]|jgi:guanylate kinase|nr:guanylate kinase [Coriobacteriales bacterium]
MTGNLYVVSGPSGVGKGTLLSSVLQRLGSVWLSVSATTRAPREGEADGVQYFFINDEEFDRLIAVDGLLEWATVHGERYGTIRKEVVRRLDQGTDVILEIDPQGALQVHEKLPQATLIFIAPPSLEDLEQRLRGRATEDEASIRRRMANAVKELEYRNRYQVVIVNDDLTTAVTELYRYITEKSRDDQQQD